MADALRIFLDKPTVQDKLDFDDLKNVLKEIVISSDTPLTIGIFGSWGTGKTSLMKMVMSEVEGNPKNRTVWFNAWKYDEEDALWRAFILRVIDSLRPRVECVLLDENELVESQIKMLEDLDKLEESLYRPVEWKELGQLTIDWGKALTGASKLMAQLAFLLIPGAAPFVKIIEKAQGLLAEGKPIDEAEHLISAFKREAKQYRREHLKAIEQFEQEFSKVINQYVIGNQGRLVVFVDDLDRCLPEKSIEILEAIKLFLDVSGCIFVIGMDEDVIEKGVAIRYFKSGFAETDISTFGEKYLQKMIQVPFRIPTLSLNGSIKYVDGLIEDMRIGNTIPLSCRRIIAIGCPSNPRQIKRTINLFLILKEIAESRQKRGKLERDISLPLLAKTVALQTFYSEFYADWIKFPLLIQRLEDIFDGQGEYESKPTYFDELISENHDLERTSHIEYQSALLQKYSQEMATDNKLIQIISYGSRNHAIDSLQKEKFNGLSRSQILTYIYLARTSSEKEIKFERLESDIWSDLLSNDLVRVNTAADQIREAGEDAKKIYINRLYRLLRTEGENFDKKLSAGKALSYLGDPRDFSEKVLIEAGEFQFGQENVITTNGAFYIGKYLVTNSEYQKFISDGGYKEPSFWTDEGWDWLHDKNINLPRYWEDPRFNLSNYPVVGISWYEAQAYCTYVGGSLPSEKEWERVSRGMNGITFPWGEEYDINRANAAELNIGSLCPVGMFTNGQSEEGVLDLSGQAWEWTCDKFNEEKYVLKGGTWRTSLKYAETTYRFGLNPEVRDEFIGFRILIPV